MRLEDVRGLAIFDGVTDQQLSALVAASEGVECEAGVVLWHAGDPADFWWVNVEGTLDLSRTVGGERVVLGQFTTPGRWAGGFRAWDEGGTYLATGTTTSRCRILKVPAPALGTLLAELPLVSHLVDGLFRTARSIESNARQREALVTLGTLSAGLAHELNNPAAATARAVDSLETSLDEALASLARLAGSGITAAQYVDLHAMRHAIVAPAGLLDPLASADLEDELAGWLSRHGVEHDWVIAPALAAGGLDIAWCERVLELVGAAAISPALEWVASTLTVRALLDEVKESTSRISGLVAAVKSYTQMDRAARQQIDVTEGIESTLVMLGHKLREGIVVERRYADDLPRIEAYAGELNQVWTNLVDNAVDAMAGQGTLTVATRAEGGEVVVEIGDTGSGMSDAVAHRAFEAFFTTKEVGKGTGLGLDIARRIVVERHGGTITIESRPGDTVLRVTLPLGSVERG